MNECTPTLLFLLLAHSPLFLSPSSFPHNTGFSSSSSSSSPLSLTIHHPPPSCPLERPTPLLLLPAERRQKGRKGRVGGWEEEEKEEWKTFIQFFTERGVTVG